MSGWGDDPGASGSGPPPPPPPPPGGPPPPPPPGAGPSGPGDPWGGRRAGIIPLHPMSLGDVLDTAFKLFRATLGTAVLTVAVVYGPLSLLTSLPGATLELADPADPFAGMSGGSVALSLLAIVVAALVGPLVTAAVTILAIHRERGIETSWQDAYRLAGRRYGTILLATLQLFLVTLGAAIAIVIPAGLIAMASTTAGVILGVIAIIPVMLAIAVLFYLIVPVILLEDVGAWESIRRSATLARRRFWPVVGTVIVAALLIGIIGAILSGVFTLGSAVAGSAGFVLQAVGSTVSGLVTVPLTANVALLIYLDLRIRHEGLDIEILTADLSRGS